jgi:hypothetical protein
MSDMIIGDRIRGMREEKKLLQGDIEKRTDVAWGSAGKEARYLNKLRRFLSKSDETDRKLLLQVAQKMAIRHPRAS